MSNDAMTIQLIRILPMVEAIHNEARIAATGAGGIEAADYCVSRFNHYVQKVISLTQDDLLTGLTLEPEADSPNETKMQQVLVASSELTCYLQQRIGISSSSGREFNIGTIIHQTREREEPPK